MCSGQQDLDEGNYHFRCCNESVRLGVIEPYPIFFCRNMLIMEPIYDYTVWEQQLGHSLVFGEVSSKKVDVGEGLVSCCVRHLRLARINGSMCVVSCSFSVAITRFLRPTNKN